MLLFSPSQNDATIAKKPYQKPLLRCHSAYYTLVQQGSGSISFSKTLPSSFFEMPSLDWDLDVRW